jgi:hypothetical protein
MGIRVIGIDCATDGRKVGLALGVVFATGARVVEALPGTKERNSSVIVGRWNRAPPAVELARRAR